MFGTCAKLGAMAYPINWRLNAAEVQAIAALAEPKMMAVGAAHLPQVAGVDWTRTPVRAILGPGSAEGFVPLSGLYSVADGDASEVSGADAFAVISTAAVSGVPRGAVLTHANFILAGYQTIAALGLTVRDRQLAALPLFHIAGLALALGVLQAGGANIVLEAFDPVRAAEAIDAHEATLMAAFPPVLAMMLDARAKSGGHWRSLWHVVGLDAPDTVKRLYAETEAKFWTGFGQSETTGFVTMNRVDERPGSAGRPVALSRVRLVDESGKDVATGEPVEIAVREMGGGDEGRGGVGPRRAPDGRRHHRRRERAHRGLQEAAVGCLCGAASPPGQWRGGPGGGEGRARLSRTQPGPRLLIAHRWIRNAAWESRSAIDCLTARAGPISQFGRRVGRWRPP